MSGLGGASVQGLFDIGGQLLSGYQSRMASKRQFKYNMWMWNAQNEYNLPSNQMKRLEDAGLNPNLVYGHGTNTLASSPSPTSQASVPNYQVDFLTALNAYQDLRQKDATTQNLRAQAQVIRAQQREIDARTANVAADTAIKQHNYGIVKGTPLFVGENGWISTGIRGGSLFKDRVSSPASVSSVIDASPVGTKPNSADYYYERAKKMYRRR